MSKPFPPGIQYFPPSKLYPDYRRDGPYVGFDPMDYCRKLRERVQSGELSWDAANALWRNYADGVAAVWVDEPRPGPCAVGGDAMPKGSDYYRDDDLFYSDGDWSIDWPTIDEEYFDEFYDEFDPATRFCVEKPDPIEPWQTVPGYVADGLFAPTVGSPSAGFEIQETTDPYAPPNTSPDPDEPGRNPSFAPGYPTSYPVDRPTVRPMVQWADGVYRDMFDPQRALEYWEPRPHPEPIAETSPYMGLAPSSSFSIKGDDCSCDDCRCGGG